ncbi:MAG: histidinol-phosphate transaminase [Tychonema bourrellyi B0820]|uniref:Histidinol-phosphate aminotransferase n=1 Tax=Tychonema bourrellyi FEM_GT703 TaxID=2040638 RepID=A0A2G4EX84_9CYAN|nr:histidinol-phosphate transaminase [Tychonema bourrellyi]MDQ2099444.1 histidinol-phosphate transaminase [Tychonema bourrellyi B0820]PHX54155.1 histidinol-phosphate transaminase [Tychonema bourrellyi FEM_GT703]
MNYFRKSIHEMSGYIPGEQPPLGSKIIKLNSNENAYLPSQKALKVLREIDGEMLRRYPDPTAKQFRLVAGQVLGVPDDWIVVGNGSDDLLNLIVRAVGETGKQVVCPSPTYVLYRTLAEIQDAEFLEVPYPDDYQLPVDLLIAAQGAVTFVASPNSPSGTAISVADLDKLAKGLSGILVIDEAYVDFAENNALELTKKYNNVIVLRTLSKGYSLAGLRLGFGIANPALIAELNKIKDSYNVDALAYLVGAAAIADQNYKTANAEKIKASRSKLALSLKELGFDIWPSQTNFLLVRPPNGDSERIYQRLKVEGILIRYFNQPRLADKLRITVGTEEQNQILIQTLKGIL